MKLAALVVVLLIFCISVDARRKLKNPSKNVKQCVSHCDECNGKRRCLNSCGEHCQDKGFPGKIGCFKKCTISNEQVGCPVTDECTSCVKRCVKPILKKAIECGLQHCTEGCDFRRLKHVLRGHRKPRSTDQLINAKCAQCMKMNCAE